MSFTLKGISNLSDEKRLEELYTYIKIQVEDEKDKIALMSNISAFIMAIIKDLNWAGFYLVGDENLILGPFQGLPACTRLDFDKGVCAKAYRDKKITNVRDVDKFIDHVVCDNNSKSELVIPLISKGEVVGVIDLDSPKLGRFSQIEEEGFKRIATLLEVIF